MSEGKITEQDVHMHARRAELAQSIIDNPIYKEAMERIKIQCFEAFASVKTSDTESLVHIRLTMSVINNVERYFERVMNDADAAEEAFNAIINDKVI